MFWITRKSGIKIYLFLLFCSKKTFRLKMKILTFRIDDRSFFNRSTKLFRILQCLLSINGINYNSVLSNVKIFTLSSNLSLDFSWMKRYFFFQSLKSLNFDDVRVSNYSFCLECTICLPNNDYTAFSWYQLLPRIFKECS